MRKKRKRINARSARHSYVTHLKLKTSGKEHFSAKFLRKAKSVNKAFLKSLGF